MDILDRIYNDDIAYVVTKITDILLAKNITYYMSQNEQSMENILLSVKEVTGSDLLLMEDKDILSVAVSLYPDVDKVSFLEYLRDSKSFEGCTIKFNVYSRFYNIRIDADVKPRIYINSGNGYVHYKYLEEALQKVRLLVNLREDNLPVDSSVFEEVLKVLRTIVYDYNFTYYLSADVDGFDGLYTQVAKICGTTDISIILDYARRLNYSDSTLKKFWEYLNSPYSSGNKVMLIVRSRKGHIAFKHDEGVISKVIHNGETYNYNKKNILQYLGMILDVRFRKSQGVPNIWMMHRCGEISEAFKIACINLKNPALTFTPTDYGIHTVIESLTPSDMENIQAYVHKIRVMHSKVCPTETYKEDVYLIERLRILLGIPFYAYTAHYQGKTVEISPKYNSGIGTSFNTDNCNYVSEIITKFFETEE